MPSQKQHIKKAYVNEDFGDKVATLEAKFICWAIVAYHYCALHWIDAFIAKTYNCHPMRHKDREDYISRDTTLKKVYIEYHQIRSDSEDVRYETHRFTHGEVQTVKGYLSKIRSTIEKKL